MSPRPTPLRWQLARLVRPFRRAVIRRLFRDDNRRLEDSLLVAGAARSGTTWLGDILAGTEGRVLFEPFHAGKINALRHLSTFPYRRPDEADPPLAAYCRQLFAGAVRHPWIDREATRLRPRYRVIKAIRANLFLGWLAHHFPEVPQLLILRHPCAVALSRRQLGWATDSDIASFLEQPALLEDHLAPFLDVIQAANTDLAKHAVIWGVSYLVPLRQGTPAARNLVFYEDLCLAPEATLAHIAGLVGRDFPAASRAAFDRPSATATAASAVVTGDDRVSGWTQRLTAAEIRQVLDIVDAFGLDYLYGPEPLPRVGPGGEPRPDNP